MTPRLVTEAETVQQDLIDAHVKLGELLTAEAVSPGANIRRKESIARQLREIARLQRTQVELWLEETADA